jgi:hypothetical protein
MMGMPEEYVVAFTSDSWDLSATAPTKEALKAAKKKKQLKEQDEQFKSEMRNKLTLFNSLYGDKKGSTIFYGGNFTGMTGDKLTEAMDRIQYSNADQVNSQFRTNPYKNWGDNPNQVNVA